MKGLKTKTKHMLALTIFVLILSPTGCIVPKVTTPPSIQPTPAISLVEAVAIAYQNVPPTVVKTTSATVYWFGNSSAFVWQVVFDNVRISQRDLGWVNDPNATPAVNVLDTSKTETYSTLVIEIDGSTGQIISKVAENGLPIGPPRTPAAIIPPPPS